MGDSLTNYLILLLSPIIPFFDSLYLNDIHEMTTICVLKIQLQLASFNTNAAFIQTQNVIQFVLEHSTVLLKASSSIGILIIQIISSIFSGRNHQATWQYEIQMFQILCVQGFESNDNNVIKILIDECTILHTKRKLFIDHPLLLNCFMSLGNCIVRFASFPIFNLLIQFSLLISNCTDEFYQKLLFPFVQSLEIDDLDRQQLLSQFVQTQNSLEIMNSFFENVVYLCSM
jgi:hypothetical protein